jgi:dynein heavy chain
VRELFPFNHKKCLNSFLVQEVARFNTLYHKIKSDTKELARVVIGEILYTDILLSVKDSLLINVIPQVWLNLSYPSVKPLVGFIKDLCLRMEQL